MSGGTDAQDKDLSKPTTTHDEHGHVEFHESAKSKASAHKTNKIPPDVPLDPEFQKPKVRFRDGVSRPLDMSILTDVMLMLRNHVASSLVEVKASVKIELFGSVRAGDAASARAHAV